MVESPIDLTVISRLEVGTTGTPLTEIQALTSIALSLKRIADTVNNIDQTTHFMLEALHREEHRYRR